MDTETDIVLSDPPPPSARRRKRRWWPFALLAFAALVAVAAIVASFVSVPYFAISPGDARPVADRVKVTGTETYVPKGQTLFVTVGVPKLTALSYLLSKLDPNVDVVQQERILGNKTEQQNREENLQLMGYSKDFATYVALKKLGYDVKVSDGGVVVDSLCMEPGDNGSCKRESPASKVLDPKDVLVKIDDTPVNVIPDITTALKGAKPGQVVKVSYKRNTDPQVRVDSVELTQSDDGRTILGIIPNDSPPSTIKFEFPVTVQINSGEIGGPSAGLAFTLALLDELTPGEIAGGVKYAATGTMDPTGNVGDIGGIRQKTIAVERAGAKLFLVPKDLEDEAKAEAKGKIEVVGVSTLDEALDVLAKQGGNALALGTPGVKQPG